jgi:hypothetical protein
MHPVHDLLGVSDADFAQYGTECRVFNLEVPQHITGWRDDDDTAVDFGEGFPGELEKFLAVDFNYPYMKALQTHKRHGLGA